MRSFYIIKASLLITLALAIFLSPNWYVLFGVVLALIILGYYDLFQKPHTIMRNYPVLGRLRYVLEELRPKMYQYFVESDIDGRRFNRVDRSTVYQRAKGVRDTIPFGTQLDLHAEGYEWLCHTMAPKAFDAIDHDPRIMIGNKDCKQPYSASILNISAMSFGSISANAVKALNAGAKIRNYAHNTGEGGLSHHHLEEGGDLIWQIGTAYFGCRDEEGKFNP